MKGDDFFADKIENAGLDDVTNERYISNKDGIRADVVSSSADGARLVHISGKTMNQNSSEANRNIINSYIL